MELFLYLHVLGALIFVSGVAVAGVAFESGRRRTSAAEIALLLGLSRVGVALVALGAILILACGTVLAQIEDLTLTAGWLGASLGLFILALALGAVGGQRPKQARRLAAKLAGEGSDVTSELRALLDDLLSRLANYLSLLIILAVLALMVFKP